MLRWPISLALALCTSPALARPASPSGQEGDLYAVLVTSRGKIGVKLLPSEAPIAVKNFVELARGEKTWTDPRSGKATRERLYDGTFFHRVIPGFMIQGGDPLTRGQALGHNYAGYGTGGPGYKFADELTRSPTFRSPCQLAMANSGPNTNGSQFFVTEVPTPHLDARPCAQSPSGLCGYVRLGQGVCGCERVAEIARAGNAQTRLERVEITSKAPTCR
jgi:peptidylprolyl isomerase/peptidyl-prolyl cis-trans isomerase A (cyclophilin A)